MVALGTFLPWISYTTSSSGAVNRTAWQLGVDLSIDGFGPAIAVGGLALAGLGSAMLVCKGRRLRRILACAIVGSLLGLVALAGQHTSLQSGGWSVEFGYWICVIGAIVALGGSITVASGSN